MRIHALIVGASSLGHRLWKAREHDASFRQQCQLMLLPICLILRCDASLAMTTGWGQYASASRPKGVDRIAEVQNLHAVCAHSGLSVTPYHAWT